MHKPVTTALAGAAAALVMLTAGCSSETATVETVDAPAAVEIIESGERTVIDVRTAPEFVAGHVDGAENIDVTASSFAQEVERLDKDAEYLVYCQSGNRSADAAEKMVDLGFTDVVDGGGIVNLQGAGADIVAGP